MSKWFSHLAWPPLRATHPGLWMCSLALILFHALTGVNEVLLSHSTNHFWDYTRWLVGGHIQVWSAVQFLCAAMVVAGLYGRFGLARIGFGASFIVANVFTVTTAWAVINFRFFHEPPEMLTFAYPICTLAMSLISYAALRETENPEAVVLAVAKSKVMRARS